MYWKRPQSSAKHSVTNSTPPRPLTLGAWRTMKGKNKHVGVGMDKNGAGTWNRGQGSARGSKQEWTACRGWRWGRSKRAAMRTLRQATTVVCGVRVRAPWRQSSSIREHKRKRGTWIARGTLGFAIQQKHELFFFFWLIDGMAIWFHQPVELVKLEFEKSSLLKSSPSLTWIC